MTDSYYDQLAPFYKYIYRDWESSVGKQAAVLDQVIQEYFGDKVGRILDAACGIGTQAIGLAELGYQITGTDISSEAIRIAKKEAKIRKLEVDFTVADMKQLEQICQDPFDLILACDNAVPHLLSKKEILKTFKGFYSGIVPGGGCLISVRDYGTIDRIGQDTRLVPRLTHQTEDGRLILFDLWEFDGDKYQITTYILEELDGKDLKATAVRGGKYYCIEMDELEHLFLQAGFQKVITIRDRYFQPLLLAQKEA